MQAGALLFSSGQARRLVMRLAAPALPAARQAARRQTCCSAHMHTEVDCPMTDATEHAKELDRLVTQGHQDANLHSALAKKFPNITQLEIEAAHTEIAAGRRLKLKVRPGSDDDRTD